MHLITLINTFVTANELGVVFGEAGMLQLFADEVRIPDVSFISHARLANSGFPHEAAPLVAPDLAVEVVSRGNTRQEMDRKLKEYFEAGARAVWYVYPEKKKVLVYNSSDTYTELGEDDILDGAPVLPGFTLELKALFAQPGGAPAQPK